MWSSRSPIFTCNHQHKRLPYASTTATSSLLLLFVMKTKSTHDHSCLLIFVFLRWSHESIFLELVSTQHDAIEIQPPCSETKSWSPSHQIQSHPLEATESAYPFTCAEMLDSFQFGGIANKFGSSTLKICVQVFVNTHFCFPWINT